MEFEFDDKTINILASLKSDEITISKENLNILLRILMELNINQDEAGFKRVITSHLIKKCSALPVHYASPYRAEYSEKSFDNFITFVSQWALVGLNSKLKEGVMLKGATQVKE